MIRELVATAFAAAMLAAPAPAQSRTLQQGAHRMEITLERLEKGSWHVIDPGLVLEVVS